MNNQKVDYDEHYCTVGDYLKIYQQSLQSYIVKNGSTKFLKIWTCKLNKFLKKYLKRLQWVPPKSGEFKELIKLITLHRNFKSEGTPISLIFFLI